MLQIIIFSSLLLFILIIINWHIVKSLIILTHHINYVIFSIKPVGYHQIIHIFVLNPLFHSLLSRFIHELCSYDFLLSLLSFITFRSIFKAIMIVCCSMVIKSMLLHRRFLWREN